VCMAWGVCVGGTRGRAGGLEGSRERAGDSHALHCLAQEANLVCLSPMCFSTGPASGFPCGLGLLSSHTIIVCFWYGEFASQPALIIMLSVSLCLT